MKIRISAAPLEAEFAAQLSAEEATAAIRVGEVEGNFTLTLSEDGKLSGYVVFSGQDATGYFVIYAARNFRPGLASVVIQSLFGAASVAGKPLRVHTEKIQALARMMGADLAALMRDAEGVPMGVFADGQQQQRR